MPLFKPVPTLVRRVRHRVACGCLTALLLPLSAWADLPQDPQAPAADVAASQRIELNPELARTHWYSRLPFIPVPEVGSDPDSGTTVGFLPVWLITDEQHRIRRIIAPDVQYNQNFGYGFHGRVYDYPSEDKQWTVEAGVKERVERGVDYEYTLGRLRQENWSFVGSAIYDRNGSSRFFGIGNDTPERAESNFTNQQELLQAQLGFNYSPRWQVLYTARVRVLDVLPGTLSKIPSTTKLYANIRGIGTNYEQLNRLSIIYDSRDSFTAPRQGMKWVAYGGMATHRGLLNDALYSEAGIDGRVFWPLGPDTILATHMSLRYLPSGNRLPFWALSSLGGGTSVIGGGQPLRGFGDGRFYDRNSFSTTLELRHEVFSFDAMSHVEIEVTPFVDVGDVFRRTSDFPIEQLHKVAGVGFRGIARPSVVGYVDVGYGSEGAAVFTGINYPF